MRTPSFMRDCVLPPCQQAKLRMQGENLTKTDRVIVMVMVMLTDVVAFLFCTYGISKFIAGPCPQYFYPLTCAALFLILCILSMPLFSLRRAYATRSGWRRRVTVG